MKQLQVLVLNPDNSPLDVWSWQEAISDVLCKQNTSPILFYEDEFIRDGKGNKYPVPCIIVLKKYVNINKIAPYSKANIYARDMNICQYCGKDTPRQERTVDHVIPRAHWNPKRFHFPLTGFENVVTACKVCNAKKANRTPMQANMILINKPKKITRAQVYRNKILLSNIPKQWEIYLGVEKT